ncbi:MAG: hypothetical protein SGI72_01300 [Planctomycetota bacterium]|nr:hypothetical protein [Planctomycetota bacterium]
MSRFNSLALAGVAFLGLAVQASADSLDRAGSLLVFPLFDNNRGGLYTLTVTNTNPDSTPLPTGQLLVGTVDVEFVYIDGKDCLEFNRTRRLTPNDTITVTTLLDNPNQVAGYAYVFAKSPTTGKAIKFDWLAGDSFHVAPGLVGGVDIPPVVFRAASGLAAGANTDVDNDGVRDLNGNEYEKVSDELLVPRFLASQQFISDPSLILIGLTGKSFQTIVNFLIYNDNEEVFSAQYAFDCWDRVRLAQINGAFTQDFLLTTNHALNEGVNFFLPTAVLGAPLETGWFRMDGATAFSTAASVQDPAFLAARIDMLALPYPDAVGGLPASSNSASGASLPYGIGEQANGDLVQHGPFADAN